MQHLFMYQALPSACLTMRKNFNMCEILHTIKVALMVYFLNQVFYFKYHQRKNTHSRFFTDYFTVLFRTCIHVLGYNQSRQSWSQNYPCPQSFLIAKPIGQASMKNENCIFFFIIAFLSFKMFSFQSTSQAQFFEGGD